MSKLVVNNVRVAGMAACVPECVEENLTNPIFESEQEAIKTIASTGIERKHVVREGTTASDLSFVACEKMISALGWEKDSIDLLIYVCQSRDYIAPMTSCILQNRLGLSQGCCVMDVPFGCCGFVVGMSVAASMLSHGNLRRGLLINAETNSLNRSKRDRKVSPLFGDAATVTALEYHEGSEPMNFVFGVDGSGEDAVKTKYGGMRYPTTPESLVYQEVEPGVIRRGIDMVLNGMDVFAFAIKVPPRSIKELVETFHINIEEIDLLLLHQANKFIDEKIRKTLKIDKDKCPYSLQEYGNVNGASIPLTLVSQCRESLTSARQHIIACGFGIGLQWGTMEFSIDHIICLPVMTYH